MENSVEDDETVKETTCFLPVLSFSPFIQNCFLWCSRRGLIECVPGAYWGVFQSIYKGAWLLFGILFYLFSLFSDGMRSRGKGADRVKMRDRDEKRRWGGKEYKRMKRRWEERKVGGGGRKRMCERQEAPVGSLAEHLSLKRLLLSITVSSPLFSIHLFCPATGGDTQRGKSGCLKFLLPSCVHLLS